MTDELVVGGRPLALTRWHGRLVTKSTAWWADRPGDLRRGGRTLADLACIHGEPLTAIGCPDCEDR